MGAGGYRGINTSLIVKSSRVPNCPCRVLRRWLYNLSVNDRFGYAEDSQGQGADEEERRFGELRAYCSSAPMSMANCTQSKFRVRTRAHTRYVKFMSNDDLECQKKTLPSSKSEHDVPRVVLRLGPTRGQEAVGPEQVRF